MPTPRFESIGASIPERVLTTKDLMASMVHPQPIDLVAITGIEERRVLQSHENSLSTAVDAARSCLKASVYDPKEIGAVISCSISRTSNSQDTNYFDPALSLMIKKEIGLSSALNFDVSNACSGMMTGVYLLTKLIKAGVVQTGMVVSGEQISSLARTAAKEIDRPWDPQFGSLTVGDSSAAVILDGRGNEDDRIDYIELTTCAEYSELCIGKPSKKTNNYALYTNNTEMHKYDRLKLWPEFHKRLLSDRNGRFQDEHFDYVVHHQVGLKFLEKMITLGEKEFDTAMPPALTCLEKYGNTATTSHFLALFVHLRQKRFKPRAKILFVPAASGFVTGSMSATFTNIGVGS